MYELYQRRDIRDILTPINLNEQESFVRQYLERDILHPFDSWFIIEINGKRAGSLTLKKDENELGYWLLPEFQGQGFGIQAIREFMRITKKTHYTIKSHIENTRSQRVAEKLGFRLTHYHYRFDEKQD